MPDQSNIVPDSTKSYPSRRADIAVHSIHDGPRRPASDDAMPPKFVRMERVQEAGLCAGNKHLPDCKDIPTIKGDSVGVVASQKGCSHSKPVTATKGKDRNTALKTQKKPSKNARVPCPKEGCNTTFVSNSERNRHVRTSRDHVSQGAFKCDFCGDLLSRNDRSRCPP
ncbi:hypothetical protein HETIRDRAFT_410299 [Heterobasidion irregulare TC 32-1]|uniref:C2H2-type domain-containing protein n=1 Tax=Heterobasidion irregulare (strain TC 32-1) TaxID=747525 RepID=W4K0V5_HETIT|nr:uncharacterized protein HETIRDRAFT_410299 [Heterobasidion irregulare TC 32-1]ETW79427.1 hypothetical protein HETIRDRAFT_410299 [Heterobasidion irregulare TC 32-1]